MTLTLAKLCECRDEMLTENPEHFYMAVHPNIYSAMKSALARSQYYHERWVKRWERWSGRKYEGEME